MFFVDTNIFLEVEFKDTRWKESYDFLTKVAKGELEAITSDFAIFSIILEIETKVKSVDRIGKFVKSLAEYLGLSIFYPTENELLAALDFMKKYNLDFDDALVVACMVSNKIKKMVSFDSDFDKVKEIERVEPKDIL